jgi:SHS2 domain-containing protein
MRDTEAKADQKPWENDPPREVMIRMLDHTADIGFEVGASTLEGLFDEARRALLMTVFEWPPETGEERCSVRLSAPDLETLLVRWINELVFLVQEAGFVPVRADLRIREAGKEGFFLEALLTGTPLELQGYGWQGEIKSATFHGLNVRHESEGWRAQMILDV